jgi:hypothetical protein
VPSSEWDEYQIRPVLIRLQKEVERLRALPEEHAERSWFIPVLVYYCTVKTLWKMAYKRQFPDYEKGKFPKCERRLHW